MSPITFFSNVWYESIDPKVVLIFLLSCTFFSRQTPNIELPEMRKSIVVKNESRNPDHFQKYKLVSFGICFRCKTIKNVIYFHLF